MGLPLLTVTRKTAFYCCYNMAQLFRLIYLLSRAMHSDLFVLIGGILSEKYRTCVYQYVNKPSHLYLQKFL